MNKIFSSLFKGIIYICTLPITLAILAIYSVVGVFMFFFVGIKGLILFFSGRNIFGDLPEDIEAKRRLNAIKMEHQTPVENPTVVEVVSPTQEIPVENNPYITTPAPEAAPIENAPSDFIDFSEHKEIEDQLNSSSQLLESPSIDEIELNKPYFEEVEIQKEEHIQNEIIEEQHFEEEPEEKKDEIIGTYKPLGTINDDEYDNGGKN